MQNISLQDYFSLFLENTITLNFDFNLEFFKFQVSCNILIDH